jgi:hypothetical protein
VALLQIAARVKLTYRDIGARCLLPDGQNPVEKLPYLFIELLLANDDDDLDGGDAKGWIIRQRRDQHMHFMNSHLIGLRRDNAQLRVAEMQRTSALHERQLGGGWDAAEACNKIYEVHGLQQRVTKIMKYLKRDKLNGGHQELRRGRPSVK